MSTDCIEGLALLRMNEDSRMTSPCAQHVDLDIKLNDLVVVWALTLCQANGVATSTSDQSIALALELKCSAGAPTRQQAPVHIGLPRNPRRVLDGYLSRAIAKPIQLEGEGLLIAKGEEGQGLFLLLRPKHNLLGRPCNLRNFIDDLYT